MLNLTNAAIGALIGYVIGVVFFAVRDLRQGKTIDWDVLHERLLIVFVAVCSIVAAADAPARLIERVRVVPNVRTISPSPTSAPISTATARPAPTFGIDPIERPPVTIPPDDEPNLQPMFSVKPLQ
jgi:hypothetical protein